MIALGTVFPSLGIIVVALRFRARQLQKSNLGMDDWLMIPALILSIGMGASIIVGVKGKALGYPTASPVVEGASNLGESTLTTQSLAAKILAPLALGFVKCSIVSFYRRIFCPGIGIRDPFDLATRIMLVVLMLWSVAFCLAFGFTCGLDFIENWTPVIVAGIKCPNHEPLLNTYVVSDAVLDLGLLIMPVPLILEMQMLMRTRIIVIGIFFLGTLPAAFRDDPNSLIEGA
ncbi:MAG: hypothetical protein ASARMPREDX12_009284 [Alectoria sarmentosa]|nr:MAG: hypothetical protein ASARMPREDX12_009284 [Alectoria sarmentosa]